MHSQLLIGGRWVEPVRGGRFEVINPATEELIHRCPAATSEDVELAVRAARKAFDLGAWPGMTGKDRAQFLMRIAEGIRANAEALAALETADNGKPLPEARWDVADAAGCFEYYAKLAAELGADELIEIPDARFTSRAVREPVGVVAAVIPWNYPLLMAAWKVAPALAAGCSIVLKPSELTPLTALELGAIALEAGLPDGVLNVLTGFGSDAGEALVNHPLLDKIAFTGSVPTGSKIMAAAARTIKTISLELGGKSPFIVFSDADLDQAVEWIMFGVFWNQGQVCSATSRVLVERGLYPQLLERLRVAAERIAVGPGDAEGTLLGPLVSRSQREKVLAAISRGVAEGATLVSGGRIPAHLPVGYFVEPTILADVPFTSWVWQEEIFGPVVCLAPFDEEGEAIRLANDSRFGLAAAVMSADLERCDRIARALRAGIVWINCSQPTFTEAPWGGFKQSGIGRELGRWGLESYLETKQITTFASGHKWGWYAK